MAVFYKKLICGLFLYGVILGVIINCIILTNSIYDLNGDGIINVCDVQLLIAMISNEKASEIDFNYDGKIDIKDLQILLNKLGSKVSNGDRSEGSLYFPSVFISCETPRYRIIEKEFQNKLSKFQLICEVQSKERRLKELLFREHSFPAGNVKGCINLALHISPLSPPIV